MIRIVSLRLNDNWFKLAVFGKTGANKKCPYGHLYTSVKTKLRPQTIHNMPPYETPEEEGYGRGEFVEDSLNETNASTISLSFPSNPPANPIQTATSPSILESGQKCKQKLNMNALAPIPMGFSVKT